MSIDNRSRPDEPTVSVLLPVYKPNYLWLESALDSIFQQSFKDFEVILVDDGTPEPVHENLDSSITDRPDLHFYRQSNQGFAGGTNRAFRESVGKYIAPIGQDDIWKPRKLENQVEFLREGYDAVFAKAHKINKNGDIIGERGTFPERNLTMELFRRCYPAYESVVFDKDLVANDWMVDQQFVVASDWDLWFRLFPRAKIGYIDSYLLASRSHEDQTSHRHYDDAVEEGEQILRTYADDFGLTEQRRRKVFKEFYQSKGKTLYTLGFESEAVEMWNSVDYFDEIDLSCLLCEANYAKGRRFQQQGEQIDAIQSLITALRHQVMFKPLVAIILTPWFWIKNII